MTLLLRYTAILSLCLSAFASTNITVGTAVLQTGVKRLGINLGGHRYYDSSQILKNLTLRNPGFEPPMFRSVVQCGSAATVSGCTDNLPYGGWKTGFWTAGASVHVISGTASSCATTIAAFTGATGKVGGVYNFASPCAAPLAAGDIFVVSQTVPGDPALGWWPSTKGAGAFTADNTDLPPNTAGIQALKVSAPASNDSCKLIGYFDTMPARSFITLNGTFQIQFAAKGLSGSRQVNVQFLRGGMQYTSQSISLSGSWANYSVNFAAAENGAQKDSAQLTFSTVGEDSFYLDNVSVVQTGTSTDNPTAFRDSVVSTLQSLKPGIIRMWDGSGLTNTLDNMLADQFARSPSNYSLWFSQSNEDVSYGLFDFLQLVQTVGNNAEPWIVMPITFTPLEASNLIDYLSGGAATAYGAKRVAQGQDAPWTSVFPTIHIEFGNESWNSGFAGGIIQQPAIYGARAQTIFAAMRANPNYVHAAIDLVVGAQVVNANSVQTIQNACKNNDSIAVAPYLMDTLTDATNAASIFQPTLAEAQAFYSDAPGVSAEGITSGYFFVNGVAKTVNGGEMYLDLLAEANSKYPKPLSIYEVNLATTNGTVPENVINSFVSSMGAGLATISSELLAIQHGILNQNLFSLTQWQFKRPDGTPVDLWGTVIDMGGPTNLRRPQFLAQQLANSAITPGAIMLKTTQSGSNPIWNQPLQNRVAMDGVHVIQSFAFNNGPSGHSIILLNNSLTSSEAVTFSGANAPRGTVLEQQMTSTRITDTNESVGLVVPMSSTLQNFNPSSGISLPPFSLTVLTYSLSPVASAKRPF